VVLILATISASSVTAITLERIETTRWMKMLPRVDKNFQLEIRRAVKSTLQILACALLAFLIGWYPNTIGVAACVIFVIVGLYVMFGPTEES
jgi:hypothetical protein